LMVCSVCLVYLVGEREDLTDKRDLQTRQTVLYPWISSSTISSLSGMP